MNISRKVGVLVFSGLLLVVGMASASVLDNFGEISGEADVEGPTFWAAPGGELLINEQSDTDGNPDLDGSTQEREFFRNLDLNDGEWYPVKLDYFLEAKITSESTEEKGNMLLSLEYQTEDGFDTICTETVKVNTSSYGEYQASCTGDISGNVSGFQYKIEAKNLDAKYRIQAYDYTRVEVNAQ